MIHKFGKGMIKFFKAACDEHRQNILELVRKHKEMNASQIIEKIKLSQPTISHHLKILCDAELLTAEKRGKETYYTINECCISKSCQSFSSRFCKK